MKKFQSHSQNSERSKLVIPFSNIWTLYYYICRFIFCFD